MVKLHPNDPYEISNQTLAESHNPITTSLKVLLLFDHPTFWEKEMFLIEQLYFVLEQYLYVYIY